MLDWLVISHLSELSWTSVCFHCILGAEPIWYSLRERMNLCVGASNTHSRYVGGFQLKVVVEEISYGSSKQGNYSTRKIWEWNILPDVYLNMPAEDWQSLRTSGLLLWKELLPLLGCTHRPDSVCLIFPWGSLKQKCDLESSQLGFTTILVTPARMDRTSGRIQLPPECWIFPQCSERKRI